MATEAQQLTAQAGDLPPIDFAQQFKELQAAVPQEKDPKRRAVLEKDLAHVSGVNDLLAMPTTGGGGAAPAPEHKAGVDELLAMPKLADTSDPEGNKDARDMQIDKRQGQEDLYNRTMSPGGGWFRTAAKALMPTDAGKAGVDTVLDTMTPRGFKAAGRAVLPRVLGMGGDLENAIQSTGEHFMGEPTDPALRGHATALPTSEEFDQGLTRMGMPNDPYRRNVTNAVAPVAGIAAPLAVSSAMRLPAAMKVERLQQEAQQAVGGTARERATQLVGQHPMPQPMAPVEVQYPQPRAPQPQFQDVPPSYPQPRAPEPVAVAPPVSAPVPRTAPTSLGGELEGHIAENEQRLAAAKGDRWNQYQSELQGETGPVQVDGVLDKWQTKAAKSEDTIRTAIDKVTNSLKSIRDNTAMSRADRVQALHDLKRQLGEAGKNVTDATGYAALKGNLATSMEKDINNAIKEASPAYKAFTKDYSVLSAEAEPIDRSFLKGVGESEGTTSIKTALKDPKNVDSTIAAMGPGGAAKLDALAVKHVQNELGRQTGQGLEDAITNMGPSLAKLPQARAAAQQILQTKQLDAGAVDLAKKFEKLNVERTQTSLAAQQRAEKAAEESAATANAARKAQREAATKGALGEQKAATKAAESAAEAENRIRSTVNQRAQTAHESAVAKANSYKPMLNNLQQDVAPARRVSVLRSMNDKMLNDGLINEAEHAGFGAQIERAANAADKQAALSTLSKYVAYTLTGNYMISFGGPHLVSYLAK